MGGAAAAALRQAFGVSNGTQTWLEFQGSEDEMLARLEAAGFRFLPPAALPADAVCEVCSGSGSVAVGVWGSRPPRETCSGCKGTGVRDV